MNFFKTGTLSVVATLLFACSVSQPKVETVAVQEQLPLDLVPKIKLEEPKGAAGKVSWGEYNSAMQALESNDKIAAIYYFDRALNEVYSEQQMDSLKLPEDSEYFALMPQHILFTLESLYPRLSTQAEADQSFLMQNDFEDFEEIVGIAKESDSFEETPLDSAEKIAIENFLDTMDLSRFSLPMVINERVMQEIHYLTVNARTFTEGSLSRKTILDSMIYAKLQERDMPADLIYLAFVESGFKLQAYSRAKAAGVWQFIPGTGKRYGLPLDFWVDMRRHPETATDAALSYLSDLYAEFGDWYLAMAAYNCGEGRIRRLVKEALAADPSLKKVSYWNLKLPRETMHYVPRILAATVIGHFPDQYSFTVQKQTRVLSDTVTIKDCVPLDKVSSAVGASVNVVRDLNPELVRWCTPPNAKSHVLKIPAGSREKFLAAYEKMDKTQLVRWHQYRVQKGDNLGHIARQFGVKVADVQAANNLKNSRLSVGQVLVIPMQVGTKQAVTSTQKKQSAAAPASPASSSIDVNPTRSYAVRKGDNLSSISRRFGVSSQNLMDWNNLQSNKVMIGQKLFIQDPEQKKNKSVQTHAKSTEYVGSGSYEVKFGDNLWDIAKSHSVTVQQLLEWNPGLDKKIYPGMKIKVGE